MRILEFVALVLVAVILVPSGAHLFTLSNRMGLEQEAYVVVQSIYRGWALFGAVIVLALALAAVLAFLRRGEGAAFWFALASAVLIALNLAIFFTWTHPANVATDNWTTIPAQWAELRRQWEYSHAVNALVVYAAFVCLVLSVLTARR